MNPHGYTKDFEEAMARFTGAPYAVAVESGSAALFLACQYMGFGEKENYVEEEYGEATIPKHTYPSVAASLIHAGINIDFVDWDWQKFGYYRIEPFPIVDSAKYIGKNMYPNKFKYGMVCLSFHGKKVLPIGRGGMVLLSSEIAYKWFKLARFDGRHECPLEGDTIEMIGWNMYMTPEQAVRGLELMQYLKDENISPPDKYPDLSKMEIYR